MIYANVAVNHRSQTDTFTYGLKPDQLLILKKGALVEVPFGRKLVEGVVINLKKTASVERRKIKLIKRVLSRHPVVTDLQISLGKWLSCYYGVSLGQSVFTILPRLSRKLL